MLGQEREQLMLLKRMRTAGGFGRREPRNSVVARIAKPRNPEPFTAVNPRDRAVLRLIDRGKRHATAPSLVGRLDDLFNAAVGHKPEEGDGNIEHAGHARSLI